MAVLPDEKDVLKPGETPDVEVELESTASDVEVDLVDDTPEADRGREPLPQQTVQELEDEDLSKYSKKVQERLKQMKKVWHDERREKERAMREREEALRFAQSRDAEAKQLRQRLGTGERVFVDELSKATQKEVDAAKSELRKAYESGDAELITNAQEALTDAKIRLKEIQMMRPSLQKEERPVETQTQTQQPARPAADPKAEQWRSRNTWFGADEEMTSLALGLHEKLVRNGVDPRSEDYYRQIDENIRKRFPEYFEGEPRPSQAPASRKPATVVAPVTRSTAPKKVQLSASQVAVAKKLGLTPEAYARELLKLETR